VGAIMNTTPTLRRRTDDTRGFFGRVAGRLLRLVRRQTQFSFASAALAAVLFITMLFDLIIGHAHLQHLVVISWLLSFGACMLIPLIVGRRYPRWAGLLFIGFLTAWSAYALFHAIHAHALLNTLFEAPMIGLYLGWFFRPFIARAVMFVYIVILGWIVLADIHLHDFLFSTPLVLVYTILIAYFCLETGSHLFRQAREQAMTDALTGTLNRRGLDVASERALSRAHRDGTPLSFFAVDFDNFKSINDEGGHAAGDAALTEFGRAWLAALSKGDSVARTGGDEFALIIHGDPDAACALVAEVRANSSHGWSWGHVVSEPGDSLDSLLRRADAELYRQKRLQGRDPGPMSGSS